MRTDSPKFRIPPSEELLRLIFESARDFAIFSTDEQGLVTSWNAGAERLLGFTEDEILGKTSDVIFPEADKAAAESERRSASLNGKAEDERWQMRKDGSLFWASGLLMRLAEPGAGFVKIIRDQSAKHNSDVRLIESEERFRLLATNIPQLVFVGQVDGRRTWPSPQWIEFTGLEFGESLDMGWLEAVHPDDRQSTIEAWRSAAQTGEYSAEQRIRWGKTGQYRWHQTRARPIEGELGVSADWVGTMTDIDDIRSLQGRQNVLLAELQHRTRNLLALVQAIARQTLRTSADPEEFVAKFDQRLQALSRVQSMAGEGTNKPVDLRALLNSELVAQAGGEAADRILLRGPDVSLPPVSAQALGLAIHELCTNAVKYGALKQLAGKLDIEWEHVSKSEETWMELRWVERGVNLANGPARKGYGSQLIERALPYQLNAETKLEFREDGVFCTIAVPIEAGE